MIGFPAYHVFLAFCCTIFVLLGDCMIGFPAYHVFLAFRCTVFGLLGDGMTDFPVFHYFLYRFRVSGQQKVN